MDKIFFLGGIASAVGGVGMILYQGIMFLQSGTWPSHSFFSVINGVSESLGQGIAASPGLMNALQQCPASAALIVLGMILLWIASYFKNRFS